MSAAGSSSDLPVKSLPEETACLALVADAEKWVARVKKVLQVRRSVCSLSNCGHSTLTTSVRL